MPISQRDCPYLPLYVKFTSSALCHEKLIAIIVIYVDAVVRIPLVTDRWKTFSEQGLAIIIILINIIRRFSSALIVVSLFPIAVINVP